MGIKWPVYDMSSQPASLAQGQDVWVGAADIQFSPSEMWARRKLHIRETAQVEDYMGSKEHRLYCVSSDSACGSFVLAGNMLDFKGKSNQPKITSGWITPFIETCNLYSIALFRQIMFDLSIFWRHHQRASSWQISMHSLHSHNVKDALWQLPVYFCIWYLSIDLTELVVFF